MSISILSYHSCFPPLFPPKSYPIAFLTLSSFMHFRFISSILKVIIALPPSPRILNSLSLSFSSSLTSSCCQSYILTFLLASKLNLHALPTRVNLIHPLRISPRPSLVLTIPLHLIYLQIETKESEISFRIRKNSGLLTSPREGSKWNVKHDKA